MLQIAPNVTIRSSTDQAGKVVDPFTIVLKEGKDYFADEDYIVNWKSDEKLFITKDVLPPDKDDAFWLVLVKILGNAFANPTTYIEYSNIREIR